jgi:CubicO group peptidase (beta-lactamase class C family)
MEDYFGEPWLPPEPYGSQVTLRHVLSHTSGLSNNTSGRDRNIAFPPGERFSYSGAGFRYLQEAVEEITGEDINPVIDQLILTPLEMSSSSYARRDDLLDLYASGHISALSLIGIFSIPFVIIYGSLLLPASIITRLRTGQWLPRKAMIVFLGVAAAVLPAGIATAIFGFYTARFIRTATLYGVVFWIALLGTYHLIAHFAARIPGRRARLTATIIPMLSIATLISAIAYQTPAPLQLRSYSHGNIAFTFRSTAGDLARFLIELSEPQVIPPEQVALMQTPQVTVNDHNSWGLGIGIQHSAAGDSLWHWGANMGFRSLMVIYPQYGIGIVVLTNSNDGLPLARDIAHYALGGLNAWDITQD